VPRVRHRSVNTVRWPRPRSYNERRTQQRGERLIANQSHVGGVKRMAYNYSPWLLEANKELVLHLVNLANTKGQASRTFETADQARQWRLRISELLANLARNRPQQAYVRATVRTWIRFAGEQYVVFVGVPAATDKLRGAPPGLPVAAVMQQSTYGSRFVISEQITNEIWHAGLSAKIIAIVAGVEAGADVDYIEVTYPMLTGDMELLSNVLGPQFSIIRTKPTIMWERMRGANTSANDALESTHKEPTQ
jgi:hypothetical protein